MTNQFLELQNINDQELQAAAGGELYSEVSSIILDKLSREPIKECLPLIGPNGIQPEWTMKSHIQCCE